MRIWQLLILCITIMALAGGNAWAGGKNGNNGRGNQCQGNSCTQAPEIDAASGTNAIALLTGVLLLVAERSRSRRSQN